jgi:hypothetical protein
MVDLEPFAERDFARGHRGDGGRAKSDFGDARRAEFRPRSSRSRVPLNSGANRAKLTALIELNDLYRLPFADLFAHSRRDAKKGHSMPAPPATGTLPVLDIRRFETDRARLFATAASAAWWWITYSDVIRYNYIGAGRSGRLLDRRFRNLQARPGALPRRPSRRHDRLSRGGVLDRRRGPVR